MQTETPLYDVLNYLPDGVLMVDERGVILFANEAFTETVGYSQEMLNGLNILTLLADVDTFLECFQKVSREGKSIDTPTDFLHRDGGIVHTVKSVRMIQRNGHTRFFVNIRNMTGLNVINKELLHSKNLIEYQARELSTLLNSKNRELEGILRNIDEVIWYIDSQTLELRYVNEAVQQIFGFSGEYFCSNPDHWKSQIYPDDHALVQTFFETLPKGQSQTIRFRIIHAEGDIRWVSSRIHYNAELGLFVGITHDITESKSRSEEILYLAYHDPLTALPNRSKLKEELEKRSLEEHRSFALFFIDLDNFKIINDTMGHDAGDSLLREMSRRLKANVPADTLITRFGGDEFVLLIDKDDTGELSLYADRLFETFSEPFYLGANRFFLSASIGIAVSSQITTHGTDLIKHADTAMYDAKKRGKNRYSFYNASMAKALHDFVKIENLIYEALRQNLFELHFQPLIDVKTFDCKGVEALLRLKAPYNHISPEQIIGVAEACGEIDTLGRLIFSLACDFIEQYSSCFPADFFVSVNVSPKQFQRDKFAKNLLELLAYRFITPSTIMIEVTESAIMENVRSTSDQLVALREGGIKIALDDFGTGYSSFSHLAKLPIDILKIDKSFVHSIVENNTQRHVVEAMIHLGHTLGMTVTAEGVEDKKTADLLKLLGIDTLQGFYFSKPVSDEAVFPFFCTSSAI